MMDLSNNMMDNNMQAVGNVQKKRVSKRKSVLVKIKSNGDYGFSRRLLRVSPRSIASAVVAVAPSDLPHDVAFLIADFSLAPCVKAFMTLMGWASSASAVYGSRRRSGCPGITINLEGKEVNSADGIALSAVIACDLTRILSVDLGTNNLGDAGVTAISKALVHNNRSEILDVQGNDLGHEGLSSLTDLLRTNKKLAVLHLGLNPRVGDEGVAAVAAALEGNNGLDGFLGLNTVNCTEVGAKKLANALEGNTSLKAVGLDDNPIGDDGVTAFAKVLVSNSALEFLGLNNVGMSEEGLNALADALKVNRSLRRLNVKGNRDITEEMLQVFDHPDIRCEVTGEISAAVAGDEADQNTSANVISVGSNIGVMFSTE